MLPPTDSHLLGGDDPMLQAADHVVRKLAARGITVFHNPTYGIMLMGARPDSPSPSLCDMNEAYDLHNEIAMLFAVQSVSKIAKSMTASSALFDRLCGQAAFIKEGGA